MKNKICITVGLLIGLIGFSQTSVVYDFESLTNAAPIHGQDNWFVHSSHSTVNNGNVCPPVSGTEMPPIITATTTSGSYTGSQGLKIRNLNFGGQSSFCSRVNDGNWAIPSLVGVVAIVLEFDCQGNWWGKSFRLGYDNNGDGNYSASCTIEDANELSFGIEIAEGNMNLYGANGTIIATGARPTGWSRVRLCIDLVANGGQGAGSVFVKNHDSSGAWVAHSIVTVNMGMNTTATDQTNYQNIDGMAHEQSAGGSSFIDNISVDVYYDSFTGCTVVLPIELINFNASYWSEKKVKLKWQTASEINNDYFTIERSKNGFDWEVLDSVDGAGNSSSLLSYETFDMNPYPKISYDRLKQTDFDGAFSFSNIRSVNIKSLSKNEIEIYPNPTTNKVSIKGNKSELEKITIFNTLGQNVTMLISITEKHETEIIIDLSNLNRGMYYVKTKTTVKTILVR